MTLTHEGFFVSKGKTLFSPYDVRSP